MDFLRARELPQIFDPVLNYLSGNLPRPLYNIIINVLSHTLAILYGIFNLLTSIKSYKPWEWDAQTIIPPLVSILLAYYGLVGIYRTTGWMFRTGIRMVKWGTILAAIFAGIGWIMGNNPGGVGEIIQSVLGTQSTTARRGTQSRSSAGRQRPRAWDTFDTHRQWQYQEERDNRDSGSSTQNYAQKIMDEIVSVVGNGAGEGAAKFVRMVWSALNGFGDIDEWMNAVNPNEGEGGSYKDTGAGASSTRRTQPQRKAKATGQAKRSTKSR